MQLLLLKSSTPGGALVEITKNIIREIEKIFSPDSIGTLSHPRHPPQSFDSSSQQHNCRRAISYSLLFERIRGFRFSMAAGSQSVESRAKKLDLVQLGKKIHFSLEIARCSTRARLPKGCRNFRNFLSFSPFTCSLFILHFSKPPESEVACTWA